MGIYAFECVSTLKKWGRLSYFRYNSAVLTVTNTTKGCDGSLFDYVFTFMCLFIISPFLLIQYICSFVYQNLFLHKENVKLCDQVIEMFKDVDDFKPYLEEINKRGK